MSRCLEVMILLMSERTGFNKRDKARVGYKLSHVISKFRSSLTLNALIRFESSNLILCTASSSLDGFELFIHSVIHSCIS